MQEAPSLTLALLAGVISFLSPCVLPLVPSYLGVLGAKPMQRAWGFVLGFAVVFLALGATASVLGKFLSSHKALLGTLSGILIVFFGLVMLGVFRLPALMRDYRSLHTAQSSFALGVAFAFGWSPCIGPILGSILGLAAQSQSLGQGVLLLLFYTLGLAVPFLLTGYFWQRFNLKVLNKYTPIIEKLGGILLCVLGILMLTGKMGEVSRFFLNIMPEWLQQWL